MAKSAKATGPSWKPAKGTMSGKDYGKAVSTAAKAKTNGKSADAGSTADRMKPVTPKTPTTRKKMR